MEVKLFRFPSAITAAVAGDLKRQIDETIARQPCILSLDLGNVGYMDSAGLGILVFAFKRSRELGGMVRVHRPQPVVRDLFHTTRMDQIFEIVDTPPPDSTA